MLWLACVQSDAIIGGHAVWHAQPCVAKVPLDFVVVDARLYCLVVLQSQRWAALLLAGDTSI